MTLEPRDHRIAAAFMAACEAELGSLKPGNVHVFADGHRMDVDMFRRSAQAAAPHVAKAGATVGARIEAAVRASLAAAGCNTNLGIVLLCVPLAAAVQAEPGPLRVRLSEVLDALTVQDARSTYRAIAAANPAGLGTVDEASVAAAEPAITLRQAMHLARDRDRIARAYVTDYADVFDFALSALAAARLSAETPVRAITTLHMALMAEFPDTHIMRKHGAAIADEVQNEAHRLQDAYVPRVDDEGFARLLAFDASLKTRGLNPGTTADFVVATLFADHLMHPTIGTPA